MVIFLRNRSFVSNTETTNEAHVRTSVEALLNPLTADFGSFTSLPGNGARVHVQAGEASDLFLSQRGGVSLFYTQSLHEDKGLLHR